MAEFKVGGRVICVKDHPDKKFKKYDVKKGATYTLRDMERDPLFGNMILRFEEIHLPKHDNLPGEYGYDADHFLPLDDFKEVTFKEITKEVPVGAQ